MPSPFAQAVYNACNQIPYGSVTTYREIALAINYPKAVRAVGTALRRNPQLVTTPCHRVVKNTGDIGAYAKGKKQKIALLRSEGLVIARGKIVSFAPFLFSSH